MLFHNEPAKNLLAAMRIFGSMIYKTDKRYTRRRRPDSATIKGIWLGLHGTPQVYIYEKFLTKQLGYAHHYVADELELHHLPCDCSPAARFLAGESTLPTNSQKQLHDEIMRLDPISILGLMILFNVFMLKAHQVLATSDSSSNVMKA
jgi:hypothetical protein